MSLKSNVHGKYSSLSLWERWPPKGVGAGTEEQKPFYILNFDKGCSFYEICYIWLENRALLSHPSTLSTASGPPSPKGKAAAHHQSMLYRSIHFA